MRLKIRDYIALYLEIGIFLLGLSLITGGITVAIVLVIKDAKAYSKLMTQCLKDGHKDYECYSMLNSNNRLYNPYINN